MSVASKRRFITNKAEMEMFIPKDEDLIAHVRQARGNNLHEVIDENGEIYVVSMPTKFRKALWVRRGQFVVIRRIEEGDKVKGEIEYVLDEENVLYIRELQKWPEAFEKQAQSMTREARRGVKADDKMIDDDMLPPSDSDEDEDEEEGEVDYEEEDDAENEDSSDEEDEFDTYNPNRMQAPSK